MATNGIAIVIPNADFSAKNLGKVTFTSLPNLQALEIVADDIYNHTEAQMQVKYIPSHTQMTGVSWSIISGNTYATINVNTGLVKIAENADNSTIIVKATSTYNPSISAEKVITVTYKNTVDIINSISIEGVDNVESGGYTFTINYSPTNTAYKSVIWTIQDGGDFATIDQNGTLTPTGVGVVTIKATSEYDETIYATKTVSVSNVYEQKAIQFRATTNKASLYIDEFVPVEHSDMELYCEIYPMLAGNEASSIDGKKLISSMGYITPYSWENTDGIGFYVEEDGNITAFYGNARKTIDAGIVLKQVYSVKINKNGIEVDGSKHTFATWDVIPETTNAKLAFGIGSIHRKTVYVNTGTCRYANVKMSIGGETIHDLKAFQTDDFGYLDKVTGTTYSTSAIPNAAYYEQINK